MQTREIAACAGIPKPYLSKILHDLAKSGLIEAKRGYRGGFALSRPPREVSFHDVAVAIEGEGYLPQCMLGFADRQHCSEVRGKRFWKQERGRIERHLKRMRLTDVRRSPRGLEACAGHGVAAKRSTRTRHRSRS